MEADILKSKKDIYLVQKYGGRYFEKVLFINLFYFVVSIGIATYSNIMDVPLVIETTKRYLIYFVTSYFVHLTPCGIHLVPHLPFIKQRILVVFMPNVVLNYVLLYSLSSLTTFLIFHNVGVHFRLQSNELIYWDTTSFILKFTNNFLISSVMIF